MPQVRHIAHTATTTVVSEERAAELVAAGTHVVVGLPKVPKGEKPRARSPKVDAEPDGPGAA